MLVSHGSRRPEAAGIAGDVAAALEERLGLPVRCAYADVHGPTVGDVLRALPAASPAVVVPAFLAHGYHVRTDVPRQVAASGRDRVTVAAALGPDPALVPALLDRLAAAGHRRGDAVVLAAAGSSDPAARAECGRMAAALSARLGTEVRLGWAATAVPTVAEAVAGCRGRAGRRVAVATWLLAPGLFAERVRDCGAESVAAVLGAHPAVIGVLAARVAAAAPLTV